MKKCISMIGAFLGTFVPACFAVKMQQDCINRWKEQADKNNALFLLMNQWVNIKLEGKKLADFFIKKGFSRIAIYGIESVGMCLFKELKDSEIEIAYVIGTTVSTASLDVKIVSVEDYLPDVDVVVNTFPGEFNKVSSMLSEKLNCSIIAIEDILNEI